MSHGNALDHEFTGIKFLISRFTEKKLASSLVKEKPFTTLPSVEGFKILFEASSQACSATLTTIWIPGLSYEDDYQNFFSNDFYFSFM